MPVNDRKGAGEGSEGCCEDAFVSPGTFISVRFTSPVTARFRAIPLGSSLLSSIYLGDETMEGCSCSFCVSSVKFISAKPLILDSMGCCCANNIVEKNMQITAHPFCKRLIIGGF